MSWSKRWNRFPADEERRGLADDQGVVGARHEPQWTDRSARLEEAGDVTTTSNELASSVAGHQARDRDAPGRSQWWCPSSRRCSVMLVPRLSPGSDG
jgi:hypothetical protein